MAHGHVPSLRDDGLIVPRPRRARRRFSLGPLLFGILALLLFKGTFLFHLGPADYADRLARLERGSVIERAGARVMRPDPVSEWIAARIRSGLR